MLTVKIEIEDNLNNYEICSFYPERNVLVAKKYSDGDNFGVIQEIYKSKEVGVMALDGIVGVKVLKHIVMGDVLAEYKHKQLVNKYRKAVYVKRLVALHDGVSGDVIKAQFIY